MFLSFKETSKTEINLYRPDGLTRQALYFTGFYIVFDSDNFCYILLCSKVKYVNHDPV